MIVTGNQPQLQHDRQLVFQEPTAPDETMTASERVDSGVSPVTCEKIKARKGGIIGQGQIGIVPEN